MILACHPESTDNFPIIALTYHLQPASTGQPTDNFPVAVFTDTPSNLTTKTSGGK
jgi:hypothetical protein